jgi:mannitol/fructose-specific phosphotransferase system IIA component (Ntr-type)
MNLERILTTRSVQLNFKAADKEETLSGISAFAAEILNVNQAPLLSAIRSREALGSTALGAGFMLPHGKSELITHLSLFLFRTAADFRLDFDSPDGLPIKLIALILTPMKPEPNYLKLITILGRLWETPQSVRSLMSCPDSQTFRQTFLLQSGSA